VKSKQILVKVVWTSVGLRS